MAEPYSDSNQRQDDARNRIAELLTEVLEDVQKRIVTGRPSKLEPAADTARHVFETISEALRVSERGTALLKS